VQLLQVRPIVWGGWYCQAFAAAAAAASSVQLQMPGAAYASSTPNNLAVFCVLVKKAAGDQTDERTLLSGRLATASNNQKYILRHCCPAKFTLLQPHPHVAAYSKPTCDRVRCLAASPIAFHNPAHNASTMYTANPST
jgi:hypothetical protein